MSWNYKIYNVMKICSPTYFKVARINWPLTLKYYAERPLINTEMLFMLGGGRTWSHVNNS